MRLGGGYQDEASPQLPTNCAMGIYKDGALFGVSTINVTLGFFQWTDSRQGEGSPGRSVIPPFLILTRNRDQATRANFCLGVMPPRAIFGRS